MIADKLLILKTKYFKQHKWYCLEYAKMAKKSLILTTVFVILFAIFGYLVSESTGEKFINSLYEALALISLVWFSATWAMFLTIRHADNSERSRYNKNNTTI